MRFPCLLITRVLTVAVLLLVVGVSGAGGSQKLAFTLARAGEENPEEVFRVWVFFKDKGYAPEELEGALRALGRVWDRRSLERRAKTRRGPLLDSRDLPLDKDAVDAVCRLGARVRARSRWLNAVSVEVPGSRIGRVAALPTVRKVIRVGRYRRPRLEVAKGAPAAASDSLYGDSFGQVDQIQVPALHSAWGLTGQGVRVALLDTGFDREHECLQHVKVFAEWDFLFGDPCTANEPQDTAQQDEHGTMTLSVAGGYKVGRLIGPAYGADYVLAKTEMDAIEAEVEEDYWVEGIEWAESLGVDIVSSSLGYLGWYTYADMDGDTPVTTEAADLAAANGVLVVNSAGNEGNTHWRYVIAPADGDSVLAVGAVGPNGTRVAFSSVGPTSDGRIKPDVMAQGFFVYAASPSGVHAYTFEAHGTSFSAPLVAGLAALLLEAHPEWGPMDVMEALKRTATRAGTPDFEYGYGICQGSEAVEWAPEPETDLASSGSRLLCPNPFRPGDRITLSGETREPAIALRIYDCLGRLVFETSTARGTEGWRWDGVDRGGGPVSPGVYFVRWRGGEPGRAHKIVLVR